MDPQTGTNSNTSGAEVASIGSYPATTQAKIADILGTLAEQIKAVVDGEADAATVDYMTLGGNDRLPDAVLDEIARRLVVTFETVTQGNIIYSPTEPTDHTKAWIQTDPVSGIPTATVKKWDESQQAWVPFDTSLVYVPPSRRHGRVFAAAGASTVNLPFADIQTVDFLIVLTPTTFDGTSWATPPITFPTAWAYSIVNRTNTLVSIAFYGMPTGGLYWEVDIEARV